MRKTINSFLTTFTLISRIPVRAKITPDYRRTVFFMPVIGIIASAMVSVVGVAGLMLMRDAFLAAVVVLVAQYGAFNLFHFDGLLDSADALIVFGEREKRLTILKDARIGSFALFSGVVYLVAKIYLLYRGLQFALESAGGILDNIGLFIVFASYCVSGRAAGAFLPTLLEPAREGGLGALLGGSRFTTALIGSLVSIVVVLIPWLMTIEQYSEILIAIPAFATVPVAAGYSGFVYRRKIGGYTGDAIGLAVELGELIHLFLFVLITGYMR